MISKQYVNLTANHLAKLITLTSVLLASWVMYIQQGWITDDSVLYFEAARLFSLGLWKSGLDLYSWPLYSLLIAGLHKITTLDIQFCAQILTAVFFALTTHSFLRIIQLAGGNKVTIISGALLFFSTTYIVGDVLPMLLRDQGFWAFLLTAIVFFIKFYRYQKIKDAFYWQLFSLIAMLFRIEAAIYIALLPLLWFYYPDLKKIQKIQFFLKSHIVNLTLLALGSVTILVSGTISLHDLGRFQEIFLSLTQIQQNFNLEITNKVSVMASQVLGEFLEDYAMMGFVLTLVSIAIIKCLSVAGWLPTLLVFVNYNKIKQIMSEDARYVLLVVASLAFINALLILFKVNLLSSRYVIAFGFIVLIFAAFSLQILIENWQLKQLRPREKVLLIITVIAISFGITSNCLTKKPGYNYHQDAVSYVRSIQEANSKVFYVSPRARFYAGEAYAGRRYDYWQFTEQAIQNGSIYQYDYLVINLDINSQSTDREKVIAQKLTEYKLIKVIHGYKNKKRMLIYEKIKS